MRFPYDYPYNQCIKGEPGTTSHDQLLYQTFAPYYLDGFRARIKRKGYALSQLPTLIIGNGHVLSSKLKSQILIAQNETHEVHANSRLMLYTGKRDEECVFRDYAIPIFIGLHSFDGKVIYLSEQACREEVKVWEEELHIGTGLRFTCFLNVAIDRFAAHINQPYDNSLPLLAANGAENQVHQLTLLRDSCLSLFAKPIAHIPPIEVHGDEHFKNAKAHYHPERNTICFRQSFLDSATAADLVDAMKHELLHGWIHQNNFAGDRHHDDIFKAVAESLGIEWHEFYREF